MSQALKLQPSSAPLRFAAAAHRIATAAAAPLPLALASQHIRCGVAEMADAVGLPELAYRSNGSGSAIVFETRAAAAAAAGVGGGAGGGAGAAAAAGAAAGAAGAGGALGGCGRKCMLGHVPEWMAWDAVAHAHAALERRALQEIVTKTGAFVVEEEPRLIVTGRSDGGSAHEGLGVEEEMERGEKGNRLMALVGAASGVVQAEELKIAAWKKQALMAAAGLGTGAHQLGVHALRSAIHSLGSDMGDAAAIRGAAHKGDGTTTGSAAAGMGDADGAAAGLGTGAHQLGVHALRSAIHSLGSDMGDSTSMGGAAVGKGDADGAVELASTGHFAAARSHFLRALSRHQQSTASWTSLGLCLQLSGQLGESEAAYTRALLCPSSLPPPPHHSTVPSPAAPPPPPPPPPPASASHVTWSNLSLLLRAQGRLSDALSAAHNALLLAPAHGPSLCSFALLSAAAGRWNDAVDAFQRAREVFGVQGVGDAVREAVRVNLQVALKWQARAEEEREKVEKKREERERKKQEKEERERRKAERATRKEAKRVRKQERLERQAKKEQERRERAEKHAPSLGATPAEAAARGAENPKDDAGAAAALRPPEEQGAAVAVRGESGGEIPHQTAASKAVSRSKDYQSFAHNVAASGFSWEVFKLPRPVTLPSNEKRKQEANGIPQILGSALEASKGKEAGKAASGSVQGLHIPGSGVNAAVVQGVGLRPQPPEAMVSEHAAERAVNGFHVAPRSAGGRDAGSDRNRLPDLNDWLTAS
ncbi:unnamed protein product [Closterium sp. Yama58-4]|nr:unnamed protein product [Closterium sp. Yama58-4]